MTDIQKSLKLVTEYFDHQVGESDEPVILLQWVEGFYKTKLKVMLLVFGFVVTDVVIFCFSLEKDMVALQSAAILSLLYATTFRYKLLLLSSLLL